MIKERSSNFLDTRYMYINLCYDRLWSCKSEEKKMSEKLTGEWFMSSLTFVRFQIMWECDASCVIVILGSQSGGNHLSLLSAVFTWLFHYVTPRTCRDPVNSIHSDTSRSCFSPTSFSFLPSMIKSMLYYSMLLLDLRLSANCFELTWFWNFKIWAFFVGCIRLI